ncbi:ADP-ribosylation factor GTPase-activating family protein [Desulfotruncus alcoholivorax]|uniref:hypothetical protein n=1 Tax=Desulfotruncus alcoholivorax TaxID=265477 RepID=UPI000410C851|nr:hypothetical protein [Desulfotruncus alcoholivorax]
MSRDSAFALGTTVKYLKYPVDIRNIKYNNKVEETLKYLKEAEYLPVSTIAILLGCSRGIAQKLMVKMWEAHLVKCIEITTYSTPSMLFKLWVNSLSTLPRNANEACRLAMLGAFYARTKKELPGFEWNLVKTKRSKVKKNVYAEMVYLSGTKNEKTMLLIDAPRRGENINPEGDIYIFPTIEEAKVLTPNGKRFTTDIMLMNKNINFANLISDPVKK